MRQYLWLVLWLVLSAALWVIPVQAEGPQDRPFEGSIFFAGLKAFPGGGKVLHLGGGGEAGVYKGLKIGGDLGYVFVPNGGFGAGAGLLSVGGAYHFSLRKQTARKQTVPFAAAGYALGFRSDTQNLFYYGGGVTHWFKDRAGVRFEVRDYLAPASCCGTGHLVQFRIGLAFR